MQQLGIKTETRSADCSSHTEHVATVWASERVGSSGRRRPDALVFFALKKTRASGRNVSKVFNPVVKLVLENQPFLMPKPAEKPSLQFGLRRC